MRDIANELEYPIRLTGPDIGTSHETEFRAVVGADLAGESCRGFVLTCTNLAGTRYEYCFHIQHEDEDDR